MRRKRDSIYALVVSNGPYDISRSKGISFQTVCFQCDYCQNVKKVGNFFWLYHGYQEFSSCSPTTDTKDELDGNFEGWILNLGNGYWDVAWWKSQEWLRRGLVLDCGIHALLMLNFYLGCLVYWRSHEEWKRWNNGCFRSQDSFLLQFWKGLWLAIGTGLIPAIVEPDAMDTVHLINNSVSRSGVEYWSCQAFVLKNLFEVNYVPTSRGGTCIKSPGDQVWSF